jgi:drug/metabolite transporter (DMT)-like permease
VVESGRFHAPANSPGRGIAFLLLGTAILTMNDTILKWLTSGYPTGQLLFMRSVFVVLPITLLVWRMGGLAALRVNDLKAHALRGAFVVGSAFCFVTGLRYLPLADAIAITFAGPLFITALAAPVLKETVGWRRWTAVLVGFVGVLVMTRPAGGAIQLAALWPLAATFFGALRDLTTRHISTGESSISLLCTSTAALTVAGLATAPFGWQPIAPADLGLMAAGGILVGSAHFLMIECFRLAEAGLLAPFKYSNMVWAILFGFIVWGEFPDAWTLTGAAFVVASGLYILRRESRLAPPRAEPPVTGT